MSGPLAETNRKNTVDLVRLILPSIGVLPCAHPSGPRPYSPIPPRPGPHPYLPTPCPPWSSLLPAHPSQVSTHHLHSSSDDEDDRLKEFSFPEEAVLQQVGCGAGTGAGLLLRAPPSP